MNYNDLENPKGQIGTVKLAKGEITDEKDKKAKAWDIVNNKFIDLALLKRCRNSVSYNTQAYGQRLGMSEFDFLKGVANSGTN